MKQTLLTATLALACVCAAPTAAAQIADIRPIGRTSYDPSAGMMTQWPGSGFETRLHGRKLVATISDTYGDNYMNVEVDGVSHVLDLAEGASTYTLFSGEYGEHTIRVTRRTGPLSGQTHIQAVRADGRLEAPVAPERRILAIGDSLITGLGVEGPDQHCPPSHATQNHDLGFPALVARNFWSDLQTVAVDGRGLVRNYSGVGTTMETLIWRSAMGQPDLLPVDAYKPQAVIISLGITDFTADTRPEGFAETYDALLRRIRTAWPEAEVFATFGALLYGESYQAGKKAVQSAVKVRQEAGDSRVQFVELTPPDRGARYGCSWHPGTDAHRFMAGQIETAIQKRLGWIPDRRYVKNLQNDVRAEHSGAATNAHFY